MARILVVDDEPDLRETIRRVLTRFGHQVEAVANGAEALRAFEAAPAELVITDLMMPGIDGLAVTARVRELDPLVPVVLITAFATVETAVSALRSGAWDYLAKPFAPDALRVVVDRALGHRALGAENRRLRAALTGPPLVGGSPAMVALAEALARIAPTDLGVLVTGESGTGKEVVARSVHAMSRRASRVFVPVDCGAIPASLVESELFGHEKGAFTGADRLRKGRFELADGGTLLLDEISEIPPDLQAKLLRVLQEKSFERVGSSVAQKADVRIIATTNRDLAREVDAGRFRADLYFRLNVLPIRMPALRDRTVDVAELSEHFLGLVADREGGRRKKLAKDALARFEEYAWPGNVRELQNLCERAAVLASGDVIPSDLVEPWLVANDVPAPASSAVGGIGVRLARAAAMAEAPVIETFASAASAALAGQGGGNGNGNGLGNGHAAGATAPAGDGTGMPSLVCDGALTLDEIERRSIVATLERNRGHRQKSAKALGIGVRTLGLKLKKWKEESLVPQEL